MNRRLFLAGLRDRLLIGVGSWLYGLPSPARSSGSLTADQQRLLEAVLDTLVPADDYPGAVAAGIPDQIQALVSAEARHLRLYRRGLDVLAGRVGETGNGPFHALSLEARTAILEELARGYGPGAAFFMRVRHDVLSRFYASPAAYAMLGYQPPLAGYAYRPVKPGGGRSADA